MAITPKNLDPQAMTTSLTIDRIREMTPEQLALLSLKLKNKAIKATNTELVANDPREYWPLSFQQKWFFHQPSIDIFGFPFMFAFEGSLSLAIFEKAFEELGRRHKILRSRFLRLNGDFVQNVR